MDKLIALLSAAISFGIVLRCMAGGGVGLSWEPQWERSDKMNGERQVSQKLPMIKMVDAEGDDVVVEWSCTDEKYVSNSMFHDDWKMLASFDGSKNEKRIKLTKAEYLRFEDECEGRFPRIGDQMSFWRGGKMYGLMEVGYDTVEKVHSPRRALEPDLALKHSVYMATNDMLGCVLKLVSSDKTKANVYLGTWFVKTDSSGTIRLWVNFDQRDGLYSNASIDENGDAIVYVGRDGVQASYKLKKESVMQYRRIVQSGGCLRMYKSDPGLEACSLPRRILGADVSWKAESFDDLKEDVLDPTKRCLRVWADKQPKALPADSPFDTVRRMYRYEDKTLYALDFIRTLDMKSECVDCKKEFVEDVADRVYEEIGVLLELGDSLRAYNFDRKYGINGAGRRRDGIRVSLAMSKEDVNSLVKIGLLIEFEGAVNPSQTDAVPRR